MDAPPGMYRGADHGARTTAGGPDLAGRGRHRSCHDRARRGRASRAFVLGEPGVVDGATADSSPQTTAGLSRMTRLPRRIPARRDVYRPGLVGQFVYRNPRLPRSPEPEAR